MGRWAVILLRVLDNTCSALAALQRMLWHSTAITTHARHSDAHGGASVCGSKGKGVGWRQATTPDRRTNTRQENKRTVLPERVRVDGAIRPHLAIRPPPLRAFRTIRHLVGARVRLLLPLVHLDLPLQQCALCLEAWYHRHTRRYQHREEQAPTGGSKRKKKRTGTRRRQINARHVGPTEARAQDTHTHTHLRGQRDLYVVPTPSGCKDTCVFVLAVGGVAACFCGWAGSDSV